MVIKFLLIEMFIIAFLMYLVILGSSKTKSEEERKREDEEQIKALEEAKEIINKNKENKRKGNKSLKDLFFGNKNEKKYKK